VHRFIAALVLGHLHGESDRSKYYLSNQMPHSISTKPNYSIRYWRRLRCRAPFRNTFDVLRDRALFRLGMGRPDHVGRVALCDVRQIFGSFRRERHQVSVVITSPPYLDVTSFEEDQWLRLWFLGGPPHPTYGHVSSDDRHSDAVAYWEFIRSAWRGIAPLLKRNAVIICRMGAKNCLPDQLFRSFRETIISVWPKSHMLLKPEESKLKSSQISVLNPDASGCRYEIDFSFVLR
jgi:hypothetical protein